MVATAIVGSAVIGGVSSALGAGAAARAQTNASNRATDTQLAMFDKTQHNLQPFVDAGRAGIPGLTAAIPDLAAPIQLDEDWLQNTPGYKFNLAQGLKGAFNSASARGLGASGAALKGAAAFTTGLADSTYQNQFNNALANKTMRLNSLMAPINVGTNAAAGLGGFSRDTAGAVGQNMIGVGNAQAGANIAYGNAGANASNSLAVAMMGKQMGLF